MSYATQAPNVSKNFEFLQHEWKELADCATFAEMYINTDPQTTFSKLRTFCEMIVGIIYRHLNYDTYPKETQYKRLTNPDFKYFIDDDKLIDLFHEIRKAGNAASHIEEEPGYDIKSADLALEFVKKAHKISLWFYKTFGKEKSDISLKYVEIKYDAMPDKNLKALEKALEEVQRREEKLQEDYNKLKVQKDDNKIAKYKKISKRVLEKIDLGVDEKSLQDVIFLREFYEEFELSDEQKRLVNQLDEFLQDQNQNVFLLKGYAGTGKTFILNGLASYLEAVGRNSILMAPTGKASRVIKEKTQKEASTIHRAIYSMKTIEEYKEDNGATTYKYYYKLKLNEDPDNSVYIVDEASMLSNKYGEMEFIRFGSGYLLNDLFKYINIDSNNHNKKVIFVGDNAQLPPIKMKFSPALSEEYLKEHYDLNISSFELSEVIRQKRDSGILNNLMNLRDTLKEEKINKLEIAWQDDIEQLENKDFDDIYVKTNGCKPSKDTTVIAYTNKSVYEYNQIIRKHFFKNIETINEGDKIIILANTNFYDVYMSNGDFAVIRNILSEKESIAIPIKNKNPETQETEERNIELVFRDVEIVVKDNMGKPILISCKILENLLFSGEANLSSDENRALYVLFKMRNNGLKPNSEEYKKALLNDPYFNALKIKFGYAITCHKAQGSEWKNVILDSSYTQNKLSKDYTKWLYTAVSRASEKIYILNYEKISIFNGIKANSNLDRKDMNRKSKLLKDKVTSLLNNKNVDNIDIKSQPYLEKYTITKNNETAIVDFNHNGKNIITSIHYKDINNLSEELKPILDSLKNQSIDTFSGKNSLIDFTEKFLKDFYDALNEIIASENIKIENVEHQSYRERYTFIRNNERATIDFIYNGKGNFTSQQSVKSNSDDLINNILEVINEHV